jgi:hypothetical protein
LNVNTGQIQGKTARRYASADAIRCLIDLIGKRNGRVRFILC